MTVAENKWILVTGANRGIGFEIARLLLEQKHPVLVAARTLQKAEDAVKQLRDIVGVDSIVQPLELDPASTASVERAAAKLRETRDGKLGAIVNNAGMADKEWTQEEWDSLMAINFAGAVNVTEALLPILADGGRIVMVSSGMGQLSSGGTSENPAAGMGEFFAPAYKSAIEGAGSLEALRQIKFDPDTSGHLQKVFSPIYRISKASLNKAVQLLARDERLTSRDITISAACPGWCATDMGSANGSPPRTAAKGGESIVWNVVQKDPAPLNGRFFRDGDERPF